MISKRGRTKKTTPNFWWKFDVDRGCVKVESDDDNFPVIKRFYKLQDGYDPYDLPICEAETLIKDLNAGRKDYRRLARAEGELT